MKTSEEITRWCDMMLKRHPNIEDANFFNSIKNYMKEQRPQAEWIEKEETPASVSYYCSNCKFEGLSITPYCPWCGAKMRGDKECVKTQFIAKIVNILPVGVMGKSQKNMVKEWSVH